MQRTLASVALVITLSGAVVAQQPAESGSTKQTVWERMEQQGEINISDIRNHASEVFRSLDADGNGTISQPEMVNEKLPEELGRMAEDAKLRRQLFEKLDSSKDGKVSRQEWNDALNRDLGAADLNGDGTVTLSELSRADASSVILNALGF